MYICKYHASIYSNYSDLKSSKGILPKCLGPQITICKRFEVGQLTETPKISRNGYISIELPFYILFQPRILRYFEYLCNSLGCYTIYILSVSELYTMISPYQKISSHLHLHSSQRGLHGQQRELPTLGCLHLPTQASAGRILDRKWVAFQLVRGGRVLYSRYQFVVGQHPKLGQKAESIPLMGWDFNVLFVLVPTQESISQQFLALTEKKSLGKIFHVSKSGVNSHSLTDWLFDDLVAQDVKQWKSVWVAGFPLIFTRTWWLGVEPFS